MLRTLVLGFLVLAAAPSAAACPSFDQSWAQWDALLRGHVKAGTVDYAALHEAPAALDGVLAQMSAVCASDFQKWTKDQQVAFWVNAYNAYTLKLILEHYPLASIKDIGLLPGAAWRERFIPLGALVGRSTELSLNDVEHEILRKQYPDARLHFALVCASKSCPELRSEAYVGARLGEQLDAAGRHFLADRAKNVLGGTSWKVSSIFKWYREDFERDGPGLVPFLKRFADPTVAAVDSPQLEYLKYDWSLNGK